MVDFKEHTFNFFIDVLKKYGSVEAYRQNIMKTNDPLELNHLYLQLHILTSDSDYFLNKIIYFSLEFLNLNQPQDISLETLFTFSKKYISKSKEEKEKAFNKIYFSIHKKTLRYDVLVQLAKEFVCNNNKKENFYKIINLENNLINNLDNHIFSVFNYLDTTFIELDFEHISHKQMQKLHNSFYKKKDCFYTLEQLEKNFFTLYGYQDPNFYINLEKNYFSINYLLSIHAAHYDNLKDFFIQYDKIYANFLNYNPSLSLKFNFDFNVPFRNKNYFNSIIKYLNVLDLYCEHYEKDDTFKTQKLSLFFRNEKEKIQKELGNDLLEKLLIIEEQTMLQVKTQVNLSNKKTNFKI